MASDENEHLVQMQLKRCETFQAQVAGDFDVTFEVEQKHIHANKYVLESISTTFKSMLSENWKKNGDVIQLKAFTHAEYYQFITFLYSGRCELAALNLGRMVDMAEFYNVGEFKAYCDGIFSKMDIDVTCVFDLIELVDKYSLKETKAALDNYVHDHIVEVLQHCCLTLNKEGVVKLVTIKRGPRQEEKVFEAVCKWAESQIRSKENPSEQVYANNNEAIKAELADILPYINFKRMNIGYFGKFVVPIGFLTYEQLSAILCEHVEVTVCVKDRDGWSVAGRFVDTFDFHDALNATCTANHTRRPGGPYSWACNVTPPFPSDLKTNENVHYYFVLCNKKLEVKKSSEVTDADYLICGMTGDSNFVFDGFCRLSVSRK